MDKKPSNNLKIDQLMDHLSSDNNPLHSHSQMTVTLEFFEQTLKVSHSLN